MSDGVTNATVAPRSDAADLFTFGNSLISSGLKRKRFENTNFIAPFIFGFIALNIAVFTGPKSRRPKTFFCVFSINRAIFAAAFLPSLFVNSTTTRALLLSIIPIIAHFPETPGTGGSTMPPPSSMTSLGFTPLSARYFTMSGTSVPAISSREDEIIYKSFENANPSFKRLSTLSKIAARLPFVSTAPRP